MPSVRGTALTPIGLIFGGTGPEHGVSCVSARSILLALEALNYPVLCLGVTKQGDWVCVPNSIVRAYAIVDHELPEVVGDFEHVSLSLKSDKPRFIIGSESINCSVAFPVIHGVGGEDGALQGLLETAGISYVGSGVEASAIAMNKVTSKRIAHSVGVDVGNWISVYGDSPVLNHYEIASVGFPLFVKPVSGGSSAGITLVRSEGEIERAFRAASVISKQLIVEKAHEAPRELEVAVLQTPDKISASPVGEIKIRSDFEFYDFEAKYIADGAELITPADLDNDVSEQIRSTAIQIFQTFGCRDYARVDFFLTSDGRVVFNEINTIPGFTAISMFSRMWESAGIDFNDLVNQLVSNAVARSTRTPEADS